MNEIDNLFLKGKQVIMGQDEVSSRKAVIAIPDTLGFDGIMVYYCYTEKPDYVFEEDSHDVDEILAFIGGNPEDVEDFGAEIEIYINGERRVISETTVISIPAGTKHGPIKYLNLSKPVIQLAIQFGHKQ